MTGTGSPPNSTPLRSAVEPHTGPRVGSLR
jgi:hypothetical protein